MYSSQWLSQWSGRIDANEPDVRDLYLGVYGALGVIQAITLLGTSVSMTFGCLNAARILQANLLQQILRLPMTFFDTTPLGRIINRFSKDVDVVDNVLPQVIRAWILLFVNVSCTYSSYSIQSLIFSCILVGCNFGGNQYPNTNIYCSNSSIGNCLLFNTKILCCDIKADKTN